VFPSLQAEKKLSADFASIIRRKAEPTAAQIVEKASKHRRLNVTLEGWVPSPLDLDDHVSNRSTILIDSNRLGRNKQTSLRNLQKVD
jgi:hypothetical protein